MTSYTKVTQSTPTEFNEWNDLIGLRPLDKADILFALGYVFEKVEVDYVAQYMANLYYRVSGRLITDYYKRTGQ
jgi:hypothetical protein